MGIVLSKFQKETTTEAVLEALQSEIQALEVLKSTMEERKRRFVTNFVGFATGLYILGLVLGYFFYYPSTVLQGLGYLVPLILFPILIVQLRRLLIWYFDGKLNKNGDLLAKLKEDKRGILEQVMCQETYKVALNLLERFDEKKEFTPKPAAAFVEPKEQKQVVAAVQPVAAAVQPIGVLQELRRRTPFPVVDDRSRGAMARFMDFIVGDGPQNRFAMICNECHAHNGMLPMEEYEYAAFWCATCNALNQARKVRPVAPTLQQDSPNSTNIENID